MLHQIGLDKKEKIHKTKFTQKDDDLLRDLVEESQEHDWISIASKMGNKNARQCRERWNNYLNPLLEKRDWTQEEDDIIIEKHMEVGCHWNVISRLLKGRSGNSVRNRFLVIQRKKIKHDYEQQVFMQKNSMGEYCLVEKANSCYYNQKDDDVAKYNMVFPLEVLKDLFTDTDGEVLFF